MVGRVTGVIVLALPQAALTLSKAVLATADEQNTLSRRLALLKIAMELVGAFVVAGSDCAVGLEQAAFPAAYLSWSRT